ncbi:MAG: amino acid ABC transporter substrate-binding protein, partial [Nitrospinae bacterium]|nr:amino acid ABC transporter substrate-binding protein [Nitrospinota bacterium]
DFFRSNKMKFKSVVVEDAAEARQNYAANRCDAYTTDRSGLAAQRSVLKNPADHVILPEIISKEPLGPVVRHGDNVWGDIARWVRNALIVAEELGITSKNVDAMKKSSNPEIKRMLGQEGDFGSMLGLPKDWAYNVIKGVGNYSEIYERHIGPKTAVGLARGYNQLWTKGGILYSPPFR